MGAVVTNDWCIISVLTEMMQSDTVTGRTFIYNSAHTNIKLDMTKI